MTTSFLEDVFHGKIDGETVELQDEVQPIAIGIPCYHWLSAAFLANFVSLAKVGDAPVQITKGVYTPQAMRHIVRNVLAIPGWKRLVIIEADMILPHDALVKHALHTDPVVGSMYFQHSSPFNANVMLMHPRLQNFAHLKPIGIRTMLEKPALYKCDIVGLGCTSIRRDVLENWPKDVCMFRTDFEPSSADDPFTQGEVSHDVWFCREVRKQGYDIYLDSSIVCQHLTEGSIGPQHYLAAHAEELGTGVPPLKPSPLILAAGRPNRATRRHPDRVA